MDLTEKQMQELYQIMINLIKDRNCNKPKEVNFDDFKVWTIGLKEQYLNDEETEEFYEYVEDSINELVYY